MPEREIQRNCMYCGNYTFKVRDVPENYLPAFCLHWQKHFPKSKTPAGERSCKEWIKK